MAAPTVRFGLRRVLAQSPSHRFSRTDCHSSVLPCFGNLLISTRYYAKKAKSKKNPVQTETKKRLRWEFPAPSEPTDDVYLAWCYPRPVYEAEVALDMLRKFQQLEFASPNQPVYANLTLDMKLDKKTLEPFLGAVLFPYRLTDSIHKVVVFAEKAEDAALAREHGAAFVGATELISPILNGEIKADHYVCVPPMLNKLKALKTVLGAKFPNNKRGSVSYDIPKMVNVFRLCHEYVVANDNLIETQIATMDMPNDQIVANLDALIKDVCKYKHSRYGSFVTSLFLQSQSSEGLQIKVEPFLSEGAVKKVENKVQEEAKEEDGDSDKEEMQKSS
nr:39S ribosomal protein L1, mitochondrial isoform X1 [Pogona vitticeps]